MRGLGPEIAAHGGRRDDAARPVPAASRRELRASTAHWLLREAALVDVAGSLGRADVVWVAIKGADLATRAYPSPALRPASDLDVLVPTQSIERVIDELESDGWRAHYRGEYERRYRQGEGHCWSAHRDHCTLEVHSRLWGLLPSATADRVIEESLPCPALGPSGRRPSWSHAYILAAVHAWLGPSPRDLTSWRDLHHIVDRQPEVALASEVIDSARAFEAELPVALSASVVQRLWSHPTHEAIARALEGELRLPERRLAHQLSQAGPDAISVERLGLARLLSGRRSRSGFHALLRRFWAHPGVVDRETPATRVWPLRRAHHVMTRLSSVTRL